MSHIITRTHDHLLHICFDRPGRQNQLTMAMLTTLGRCLREADDDSNIRAILLTGAGDHFCAGGDVADLLPSWKQGIDPIDPDDINPMGLNHRKLTKPLITIVQGNCINAGLELALASDICIAADNARFAFEELRYATFPFAGGVFRFIRAAGRSNALRYILTSDPFDAAEALRLNVVTQIKPVNEVHEFGFTLARRISNSAPLGVRAALAQADTWCNGGDNAALCDAISAEVMLLNSKDCAEALHAMSEGRTPRFIGQ